MHIAFRADSSFTIGSGHLYRCLSLANHLRTRGRKILFISKDSKGHFSDIVAANGYQTIFLADNLNEVEDSSQTLAIAKQYNISTIILDHYELNLVFEDYVVSNNLKLMVIDDLMNRPHNCHILLDQNFKSDYSTGYQELTPPYCKLFLGPRYSLLRNIFYESRLPLSEKKLKELSKILIFFGGSDPDGETLRFLKTTSGISEKYHFEILVSKGNNFLSEILTIHAPNATIHIDHTNIPELMNQCDFYFGSGGSITWERMCLGLNGAIVIVAENQRLIAEELRKAKLQEYWGWAKDFHYEDIIPHLDLLKIDEINTRTEKCMNLIDSQGVQELVNAILE